jgi:hypothetical protein
MCARKRDDDDDYDAMMEDAENSSNIADIFTMQKFPGNPVEIS